MDGKVKREGEGWMERGNGTGGGKGVGWMEK